MTKNEKERMIYVLDLWIEKCESFYNSFEDVLDKRPDAVKELEARLDKVYFLNEFLESGRFIETDKYLEVADRYEKVCDKLVRFKGAAGTKGLKKQIEKTLNEVDRYMCLSNMREREIYDIQEIFRQNGFKRDSVDKWEIPE